MKVVKPSETTLE